MYKNMIIIYQDIAKAKKIITHTIITPIMIILVSWLRVIEVP
jgi:hypothetical protein